jgi:hypothetical protein
LEAAAAPDNGGRFIQPFRILPYFFGLFKIDIGSNGKEEQNKKKTIKDKVGNFHRLVLSTTPGDSSRYCSVLAFSGPV